MYITLILLGKSTLLLTLLKYCTDRKCFKSRCPLSLFMTNSGLKANQAGKLALEYNGVSPIDNVEI